jgi:D-alanyl-D-alanine carboxypeptidase/D-alanyl-D-alanine-endopeptidase (penicillin-binding protein 4)
MLLVGMARATAALPRDIRRAFLDAGVPLTHVAMVVQDVDAPRPLFAYDPNGAMNPASVMKLVTTYTALSLLGPDYRWRTEAYAGGPLRDGVLHGDLILRGRGDPRITVEQWQAFMDRLRAAGVDRITGNLVLDRSAFALPRYDSAAFDGAPLAPYNVGPDALLLNFKSVRLTFTPDAAAGVAQVAIDPPLAGVNVAAPALSAGPCGDWHAALAPRVAGDRERSHLAFAGRYPVSCGMRDWWMSLLDAGAYVHDMFTHYFRAAGGRFDGAWVEGRAPRGVAPIAVLESPPLADVVRDVNKLSNNVMARQLFLTLALEAAPPPATPDKAAAVVKRFLAQSRIAMPRLVMENGSGLSRRERVSARGLVRLLIAAHHSSVRDAFAGSLGIAGVDGTVQRLDAGPADGHAELKTGTLEGVRARAGYVSDARGHRYALAVIINDPTASRARPALAHLVEWVWRNGSVWRAELERR